MILSQVMAHPKKQCFDFPSLNLQSKLFWEHFIFFKLPQLGPKLFKLYKLGVFWNPQDLLLMMGTEIFKIDASWAEKLTKTRVSFLTAPTVFYTKRFIKSNGYDSYYLMLMWLQRILLVCWKILRFFNIWQNKHSNQKFDGCSVVHSITYYEVYFTQVYLRK